MCGGNTFPWRSEALNESTGFVSRTEIDALSLSAFQVKLFIGKLSLLLDLHLKEQSLISAERGRRLDCLRVCRKFVPFLSAVLHLFIYYIILYSFIHSFTVYYSFSYLFARVSSFYRFYSHLLPLFLLLVVPYFQTLLFLLIHLLVFLSFIGVLFSSFAFISFTRSSLFSHLSSP